MHGLHYICIIPAKVAQLVEHQLPKLRVASSNLVFRSSYIPTFCGDFVLNKLCIQYFTDCFFRREKLIILSTPFLPHL